MAYMHINSSSPHFGYTINVQGLEEVIWHEDLGVIFNQLLNCHSHAAKLYQRKK